MEVIHTKSRSSVVFARNFGAEDRLRAREGSRLKGLAGAGARYSDDQRGRGSFQRYSGTEHLVLQCIRTRTTIDALSCVP